MNLPYTRRGAMHASGDVLAVEVGRRTRARFRILKEVFGLDDYAMMIFIIRTQVIVARCLVGRRQSLYFFSNFAHLKSTELIHLYTMNPFLVFPAEEVGTTEQWDVPMSVEELRQFARARNVVCARSDSEFFASAVELCYKILFYQTVYPEGILANLEWGGRDFTLSMLSFNAPGALEKRGLYALVVPGEYGDELFISSKVG